MMPSPRRRAKSFPRGDPLNIAQFLELDMGPKKTSAFSSEDELRDAWEANREQILERYAFTLHDAGWRPSAFWYFVGDRSLWVDALDADSPVEADRLRWLVEHDAFLPGELDAMRKRAKSDRNGYAAAAWQIVSALR